VTALLTELVRRARRMLMLWWRRAGTARTLPPMREVVDDGTLRSSSGRRRFWAEFNAGRDVAEQRAVSPAIHDVQR